MSPQNQEQYNQMANFTGMVLSLTLIIIFVIISTGSAGASFVAVVSTSVHGEMIAQVIPTATVQPASPAPTFTPQPTSTPVPANTETPPATSGSGPSGSSDGATGYDPVLVSQGERLFLTCSACHGANARGLPNLGKNLVESEFVAGLDDTGLLEFIKTGRPIWDPLNTTGIDMPGKGGNPTLTDEQILAIIAYIRSLSASGG